MGRHDLWRGAVRAEQLYRDSVGQDELARLARHVDASRLVGPFDQPDDRGFYLLPTILGSVQPEVDAQIDRGGAQVLHQNPRFRVLEHGRVILEYLEGDLLRRGDAVLIGDAHHKVLPEVGIARIVVDIAGIDCGIGDQHVVALLCHEDRGAGRQLLHKAGDAVNLDQVAALERGLHAEEHTGQKVLGDVAKGDAQDQAHQAGATQHCQRGTGQARHLEDDVQPDQQDDQGHTPRHNAGQQRVPVAAVQPPAGSDGHQAGCHPGNEQHQQAEYDEGNGAQ